MTALVTGDQAMGSAGVCSESPTGQIVAEDFAAVKIDGHTIVRATRAGSTR